MNSLIGRLIATHRMLNREIRRELAHRLPDHFRVARLKKERLAVKDQLYRHVAEPGGFRRSARNMLERLRAPTETLAKAGD